VRLALHPRNRLAASLGALLGAGVPVASFQLAHHEVAELVSLPALLVLGGLAFSSLTVYAWARNAFGSGLKALGYVVMVEGVMTTSHTPWLSAAALVLLVGINAVATGARLALGGA
jgi:uncharacterized membrane protein HdeD (DUF308 family)